MSNSKQANAWDNWNENEEVEITQIPEQAALSAWHRTPEAAELEALKDARRKSAHGFDGRYGEPFAQEPTPITPRQIELEAVRAAFMAERNF